MNRCDPDWKMVRAMSNIFDGRPRKPKFGDVNTLRAITVLWIAFVHPAKFQRTSDVIRWMQEHADDESEFNASAWVTFLQDAQIPLRDVAADESGEMIRRLFPKPGVHDDEFKKLQQSVSRGMRANDGVLGQEEKLAKNSGRIYRKRRSSK